MVRLVEDLLELIFELALQFQFQCGAIGSSKDFDTFYSDNRFNSSVVRLVEPWIIISKWLYFVSIPVWCDW